MGMIIVLLNGQGDRVGFSRKIRGPIRSVKHTVPDAMPVHGLTSMHSVTGF